MFAFWFAYAITQFYTFSTMDLPVEKLLALTVVVLGIFVWLTQNKVKLNLPPGPPSLPLIGNVLQIGRYPYLSFTRMARKYGPVLGIKIGSMNAVVISNHKLIAELLSDNASAGRMTDNPIIYEFTKGPYGIVNAEGLAWRDQRRFTVRTIRDLGFAKTCMQSMILDEARAIVDWFHKTEGKPIVGTQIFTSAVVNSVWRIASGERCDWEKEHPEIIEAAEQFFEAGGRIATNGVMFAPILISIAPGYFGWNRFIQTRDRLYDLVTKSIAKHRETFDSSNIRDFMDHYLLEIGKATDLESTFYGDFGNKNMAAVIIDLFVAAAETTSSTLSWGLLYLSRHLNVQTQLRTEIDTVVGTRLPSLLDRTKMPYTQATIAEILRKSSVLPIGLPHRMREHLVFHGYDLPKGTSVFANIYGAHHNPEVWGDPENFRPERFLNEDGTKYVRHEALISFAEGKRKCLGETMARDTLFLFISIIFQQFSVLPENENCKPDYEPALGYFRTAKPFKVVMVPRQID